MQPPEVSWQQVIGSEQFPNEPDKIDKLEERPTQ